MAHTLVKEKESVNNHVSVPSSDWRMEIVTIFPDMAASWLENTRVNRTIQQRQVVKYADSMRAGNWPVTGESIKFDKQGRVGDGQHRLFACLEAGVPFTTYVIWNLADEAFDMMDSGKARSNQDVASMHGVKNAKVAASLARYSLVWAKSGLPVGSGWYTPSKTEILKWFEDHPDYPQWTEAGRSIGRAGVKGGESVWATVMFRLSRAHHGKAEEFAEMLISGAGLDEDHPVLALRRRIAQASLRKDQKLTTNETIALTIKAWNAWRKHKKVSKLVWRRGDKVQEEFPVPV